MNEQTLPDPHAFAAPYFFFSNNSDSEILYVSPSVEKILGYTPEEVIGKPYTDFLDENNPLNLGIRECRTRRFQGDGHHEHIRGVLTATGESKILQVQTYGSLNANGEVAANHGIAQDVTSSFSMKSKLHQRWQILRQSAEKMSQRESDVLSRVLRGRLNKSIARELSITERAIERIRSRLKEKFEAENAAELVAKATELKMLNELIHVEPQPNYRLAAHLNAGDLETAGNSCETADGVPSLPQPYAKTK